MSERYNSLKAILFIEVKPSFVDLNVWFIMFYNSAYFSSKTLDEVVLVDVAWPYAVFWDLIYLNILIKVLFVHLYFALFAQFECLKWTDRLPKSFYEFCIGSCLWFHIENSFLDFSNQNFWWYFNLEVNQFLFEEFSKHLVFDWEVFEAVSDIINYQSECIGVSTNVDFFVLRIDCWLHFQMSEDFRSNFEPFCNTWYVKLDCAIRIHIKNNYN